MLEVRFVEASRQAGRELGVQWNVFGSRIDSPISASRQPAGPTCPITGADQRPTNIPVGEVAAGVLSGAVAVRLPARPHDRGRHRPIDVLINALEQKGLARTLAEPNLVALSGDTASFLAGGEYPIPVPGALGQITDRIQALRRRPRLHADRAERRPDQPEDRAGGQPARHQPSGCGRRGISVPPLIVRRASTTVELRDGQSFVIGGLLQSNGQNAMSSSCPGSATCRCSARCSAARSYQKNETDLAIIVTPRLVRPARPGDVIKTPLDNTLPANDADFFLMGKTELSPRRSACAASAHGVPFTGHMLDLPKGGTNVVSVRN